MADNLPTVVVTAAGAVPTPPATLRAELVAAVAAERPGYTANLPSSLVEDIASTDVGALVVCDSALVETLNSLSPYTANAFVLSQLGQAFIGPGAAPAPPTNTSVLVTFQAVDADSNPLPGYVVPMGFTVSDGTYQYVVQDGGVTATDGFTDPLFCAAANTGSWAIPANTVTQLITSVPSTVTLSCTNETPGTPGGDAETEAQFRVRVMDAAQAIAVGVPPTLRRELGKVPGVQARLVSVQAPASGGWTVIVGGGDPYQVAYAIFSSVLDISSLKGSTLSITNITQANPGVITTDLNHGYATGQNVQLSEIVGMVPLNGQTVTATVIDEKTFSIGVNTTSYPAYVSGGVCLPNLRNQVVSVQDFPDVYAIPFVDPPQQTVAVSVTWNTSSPNFTSDAAVAQLGNPALVSYVNSVYAGQPMNLFEMQTVFQAAVASVISPSLLTRMVFAVSINGIGVSPEAGTGIIAGDPQSYFFTTSAQITIARG